MMIHTVFFPKRAIMPLCALCCLPLLQGCALFAAAAGAGAGYFAGTKVNQSRDASYRYVDQAQRYQIPRERTTTPDNAPYPQGGRYGTPQYAPGQEPYRTYPPGYVRYPQGNPPR